MNTTEAAGIRAAIRHIGPSPLNEYIWREDHLTVHSVRTFAGAWNVIVDQDAATDGSQDGITLDTAGARELARLLLDAADSESAADGPAYVKGICWRACFACLSRDVRSSGPPS